MIIDTKCLINLLWALNQYSNIPYNLPHSLVVLATSVWEISYPCTRVTYNYDSIMKYEIQFPMYWIVGTWNEDGQWTSILHCPFNKFMVSLPLADWFLLTLQHTHGCTTLVLGSKSPWLILKWMIMIHDLLKLYDVKDVSAGCVFHGSICYYECYVFLPSIFSNNHPTHRAGN